MTDSLENLCFLDFETRSLPGRMADVRKHGAYRYAKESFAIVLTYCIGATPVQCVALDRFDHDWLCWQDMPQELRDFHARVERGGAWYAAFNMGFDRQVWNEGTFDFPRLEPSNTIDVMAQAVASNLPPDLEGVSSALGFGGKQKDGKKLIDMFSSDGGATPQERPEEWGRFKSYATRDTELLRAVWGVTRKLPLEEWQDYWTSERINDRGVEIDLPFVRGAARAARASVARSNADLHRWTGGAVPAVTEVPRLKAWLMDEAPRHGCRKVLDLLASEWDEEAVVGDDLAADRKVAKLSLAKSGLDAALAYLGSGELSTEQQLIEDVLTVRRFGGSSSPAKFQKMLDQQDGGALRGQYVFNGAAQTGRFSSRGVQVHNLTRSSLDEFETPAIDMIYELEEES